MFSKYEGKLHSAEEVLFFYCKQQTKGIWLKKKKLSKQMSGWVLSATP